MTSTTTNTEKSRTLTAAFAAALEADGFGLAHVNHNAWVVAGCKPAPEADGGGYVFRFMGPTGVHHLWESPADIEAAGQIVTPRVAAHLRQFEQAAWEAIGGSSRGTPSGFRG